MLAPRKIKYRKPQKGRMTGLVYEASKTKEGQMKQNMVFADGEVDKVWLTPEGELEDEQKE